MILKRGEYSLCGNTWRMLNDTRFKDHFEFIGDFSRHYGIYAGCGNNIPFDDLQSHGETRGCC